MDYTDFITRLNCLAAPVPASSKTHHYRIQEDLVAYYCAKFGVTNKDKLDVMVLKMNRLDKSDLKLSSFTMRISNMSFTIFGKGNRNNSEQGAAIAKYLDKLILNKQINKLKLEDFINQFYKEKVV